MTLGKLVRSFSLRRKRPERSDSVTYTLYNANPEILASSSKRTKRSKSLNLPRNTVSNESNSDEQYSNRAERSSSFTFIREPEKESESSTFTLPRRKKSKELQTSTFTLYNINNLSKEVQTSMLSLCNNKDVQTSTSNLSSSMGKVCSSSSLTKKQKEGSVSSLSKESVKLQGSTSSLKKQKVGTSSELLQTSSSTMPSNSDHNDTITSAPHHTKRSSSYDRTKSEPAQTSKSTRIRSRSSSLTFTRDPGEYQTSTFTLPRRKKSKETSTLTIYNIHNLSKEVQTSLLSVCKTNTSREIQTSTSSLHNSVTNKPTDKDRRSCFTVDKSTNTQQSFVAVPQKPPRNVEIAALNTSSSEVVRHSFTELHCTEHF